MPETRQQNSTRRWHVRHRGRRSQVPIYLRKFLRMFVYQNEWKVLPMAAIIAGLVAMVVRNMLFLSREGTMMGVLALVCVAIWNGWKPTRLKTKTVLGDYHLEQSLANSSDSINLC